jgi:hypothetical protein
MREAALKAVAVAFPMAWEAREGRRTLPIIAQCLQAPHQGAVALLEGRVAPVKRPATQLGKRIFCSSHEQWRHLRDRWLNVAI